MNAIDVSVVALIVNPSLRLAIEYCDKRNIIVEVVGSVEESSGKYICIINDESAYYEPYYIHYQFVSLEFKKGHKDIFVFNFITVLNEDFFVGDFSHKNKFYRKDSKMFSVFVEDKIYAGCSKKLYVEVNKYPPEDTVLIKYLSYFQKNA